MRGQGPLDSIASILADIAHRLGLEAKMLECRLRREWPDIVGAQIAAHTRPDQIRFKKLYLSVRNSVWLQQLTFLKPVLIEKVNAVAGQPLVSEIVMRIGEIPCEEKEVQSSRFEVEPRTSNLELQASLKEAEAHAAAITDPELRARLTAVMAEALDRLTPPRR